MFAFKRSKQNSSRLNKEELGKKIIKEIVGLKAKTYNYLTDENNKSKKKRGTKSVSQKENLNLKITKIVLKHRSLNQYNNLAKNKIDVKSVTENHKDSITDNRLILK